MRKISALVLAVLLLVSVLPFGLLASAETPTSLNETFESGTVGETPDGWQIISHPTQAGAGVDNYYTSEDTNPNPFDENYKLTVSTDCYTGQKALSLKADNGGTNTTFGYVSAQSPAISVEGGKKYYFEYAIKTTAVTDEMHYYGGRVFVSEFAADGTNLARTLYTQLLPDTDWGSYLQEHTTQANTTTVRLEFYLGGKKDKNIGAEFLVDDVSFSDTIVYPPLDGTFESYGRNAYPKGWNVFSSTNGGAYGTNQYHKNYSVKVVQSDKFSGSQALEITRTDGGGTNGYMLVQSPTIDVKGSTLYLLKFARKVQNIVDASKFFGGRVYLVQYDANGNQIWRNMVGVNKTDNTEWVLDTLQITTEANADKVCVEFYIGGVINQNPGVKFLIDDFSFAEPKLDGTFESYTEDEFPLGWTTQSTDMGGPYNTSNFQNNYVVSTITGDKYTGDKALSIAHKNTTGGVYGYFVAQTPKIEVTSGAEYTLKFARKITGVDAVTNFFASRVFVVQYNAEGTQITRAQLGSLGKGTNVDWEMNTERIKTQSNAAFVKIEFYSGSHRDQNVAATILIDDLDFFTCTNHVYDDNCDEDCNLCLAKRTAPHTYDTACDVDCNDCGDVREAAHEYTDACDTECDKCFETRTAPHSWDNDCDEDCNLCGTPRSVTHDYDGDCDEECNACGDTRTPAANHTFENDCDTECDVCKATRQPAADHQYTDACDADCNVCQAPRTAPHDYDSDCDTKCNLCEEPRTTTVNHNWDEGEVTKPADCKDKGEKTYTCNDCKETKTEEIDKTGHTLGNWTASDPATCEQAGEEKRECSKCDYEETRPVAALGHNFGEPTVTEPTCTADGIKETACTRCDEKETEVISAAGHDYGEWEVTKEATETEKGEKTKTCETCGDKKTEDIPKLAPSTDADTDTDDDDETSSDFEWYWILVIAVPVILAGGGAALLITKKRK